MAAADRPRIRFGRFAIKVPGTRLQRTLLGIVLCVGGVVGFLPIVGFWMLPLGIVVLSYEYHPIRRFRRKADVWWGRRHKAHARKGR
jgi:purine-cytosine permease-like protein